MIGIGFLIVGLVCGIYGIAYYRQHGFLLGLEAKKKTEIETETDKANNSLYDITADSGYGGISALVVGTLFLVLGTVLIITSITGPKDINIDGMDISFPCTYLDIQAMGFDIEEGQEIVEIRGTTSSYNRKGKTYTVVDDSGRRFKIRFENDEEESKIATSCKIYEMTFEYAPPRNRYEGIISSYNSIEFWHPDLEMTPEQIEQANQNHQEYMEEMYEYYENYEILNSPKITLRNKVNSDMTQAEVEAIMGYGKYSGISTSLSYDSVKEYSMTTGTKSCKIIITYVTKDEIAEIRITQ